jgi:hypothetical protein
MTPTAIITDVIKEFWAAPIGGSAMCTADRLRDVKNLVAAIKAHYYKDPDDRSLQSFDSESYRAIDETVELLAELHPRERIWASPYDVESRVSDYLASQLPILNVDKLDDVACGIYGSIHEATGWRSNVVPILEFVPKSINVFNGTTRFGVNNELRIIR